MSEPTYVSGLPATVSAAPDPRGSQSAHLEPGVGGGDPRAGQVPLVGGAAAGPVESSPCQACGHDTGADGSAVRLICHVAGKEPELLALICLRCHARGSLWAARRSLRTFGDDEPLPPHLKHW